jgi:branched-chain amino acid transport system permease protein
MRALRRYLPGLILAAALLIAAPFLSSYGQSLLSQVVVYATVIIGLDLIVSRARMMSFGQAAFMAIGAYGSVSLTQRGVPFELALVIAVIGTAAVGGLLAVPASRLTGFSFALVTFAFTAVVAGLAGGGILFGITGGESGLAVLPAYFLGLDLLDPFVLCVVVIVVMALVSAVTTAFVHSRSGRALRTIRESEAVAASLGVRVPLQKAGAFAFAAGIAGLGGAMLAQVLGAISGQTFGLDQSVLLVAMLVVGGMGRTLGPIVGAAIFIVVPEYLQGIQSYSAIVFPIVFIVALIIAPLGIVGLLESGGRALVTRRKKVSA